MTARPRSFRPPVLGVSVVALGLAAATASPAMASSATAVAGTGRGGRITLVTGEVFTPDVAGRSVLIRPGAASAGSGGHLLTVRLGTHTYTYPSTVVPYLGRHLDRALFDVTSGRTPYAVRLTYRAGHPRPAVPGITAAGGHGDTVDGKVTAPAAFGRALAAQFAADRGGPARSAGLFADLASIAPATGTAPPPTAQPHFPMHTLTVHGVGADGAKATVGTVGIWNMDDFRRYAAGSAFADGVTKVSVPTGHYLAIAVFPGRGGALSFVPLPSVTVRAATSVTADARTASRLSATTPRPARLKQADATLQVSDAHGRTGGFYDATLTGSIRLAPTTRRPAVGDLRLATGFQLRSPPAASPGYDYALRYEARHTVPADQSHAPAAGSLAAVDTTYAGDAGAHHGIDTVYGLFAWESGDLTINSDLVTPGRWTHYYSARSDLLWRRHWSQADVPGTFRTVGDWESAYRAYRPGRYVETWGDQPATASVPLPRSWYCTAEHRSRTCAAMPLFTDSYHLPVDLHGNLHGGRTRAGLDLGHLAGARSRITAVTVELSYDGGTTWRPAAVTGGRGGHYRLSFAVPVGSGTDGYGALRLTAKDAAGSTLAQTVHRAFGVT